MTKVSPSRRAAVAALVVALVLALAGTTVALTGGGHRRGSAATGSVTETRVRAFEAVTANVDRVDGSVLAGQGRSATTPAAKEMVGSRVAPQTTLYRSVSAAEADDIARVGGFRAGANSYEGKLFATTADDAARYGRINDALTPGGSPFHIVETRVPTSLANSFERLTLDSMQAVHVAKGQLGALHAAGRWNIWNSVPWVGKPGAGL